MKDTEKRHERVLEQQEDLPPERYGRPPEIPVTSPGPEQDLVSGDVPVPKAERMDEEREVEQVEGLTPERRGSPAAPSDMAEREPPHPSDVNEIGRRG